MSGKKSAARKKSDWIKLQKWVTRHPPIIRLFPKCNPFLISMKLSARYAQINFDIRS
jgi:hypothetical protein